MRATPPATQRDDNVNSETKNRAWERAYFVVIAIGWIGVLALPFYAWGPSMSAYWRLLPYWFYLAGSICFAIGTLIVIFRAAQ